MQLLYLQANCISLEQPGISRLQKEELCRSSGAEQIQVQTT
jgi:hypothetical protein